jgi:hypothetical protein
MSSKTDIGSRTHNMDLVQSCPIRNQSPDIPQTIELCQRQHFGESMANTLPDFIFAAIAEISCNFFKIL